MFSFAAVPKEEQFTMAYDKLVVAVGAFSATFGTEGVSLAS